MTRQPILTVCQIAAPTAVAKAQQSRPKMLGRPGPPEERFTRFYEVAENGCWIWTGQRNTQGYGLFSVRTGEKWRAHRWSYTQKYGPIPEGLVLDHYVCGNPSCVHPDHVRPVTQRENALRSSSSRASINAAKTECKRGHPLPFTGGWRRCQLCVNERARARHASPNPRGPYRKTVRRAAEGGG